MKTITLQNTQGIRRLGPNMEERLSTEEAPSLSRDLDARRLRDPAS